MDISAAQAEYGNRVAGKLGMLRYVVPLLNATLGETAINIRKKTLTSAAFNALPLNRTFATAKLNTLCPLRDLDNSNLLAC